MKHEFTYNQITITFYVSDEKPFKTWVNASEMAKVGLINPDAWLSLESVNEIINEIINNENCKYSNLIRTDKSNGAIWFSLSLAGKFAAELSYDLVIWCLLRMVDATSMEAEKKTQALRDEVEKNRQILEQSNNRLNEMIMRHINQTATIKRTPAEEEKFQKIQEFLRKNLTLAQLSSDDMIKELSMRGYDIASKK